MRNRIVAAFTSLHGVAQTPGGPGVDRSGGFERGGWVAPHFDDTVGEAVGELFSQPF